MLQLLQSPELFKYSATTTKGKTMGEVITRKITKDELAEREQWALEAEQAAAEAEAKEAKRQEILKKLGLTVEELEIILG